jgi:flagellar basal body-associated protein FliL
MSAGIGIIPIFIILLAVLVIGAVLAVVAVSRRQTSQAGPRCGSCGYNLTGAPSNRCPECGKLFIEAGVITNPPTPSGSRRTLWVAIVLLLGLTVFGMLGSLMMSMRVRAERARAIAARQAAVQAQAAAQQEATSAPTAEDRLATQPPETP